MGKVTSKGLRTPPYSFPINNQTGLQSRSVFRQSYCCVWGFSSAFITTKLDTQAAAQLWITTIRSSFNICRSSMIMTYEIAARRRGNDNQFPRPVWRIAFPLNQLAHVSGTYATFQVSPSRRAHTGLVLIHLFDKRLCIWPLSWIRRRWIMALGSHISACIFPTIWLEMCVTSRKPSITWKVKATKSSVGLREPSGSPGGLETAALAQV